PSATQLDYVRSMLYPISSETALRDFERDTVENAIRKLFSEAEKDTFLRAEFGLHGADLTFESHTNLGNAGKAGNEEGVVSGPMQHLSISDDHRPAMASRAPPRARPKVKGMGNRADQFCIYKNADGQRVPVAAIEYKPPHKVSQGEILRGLRSTIEPKRDVIHQDGEGFAFESRRLAAAVVTQLFSYMVGK
ncbi:hypothetical protein JX266_014477, partial [Neoarthrinium moseri]